MRNACAGWAAAVLLAAAFFLPAKLSQWGDRRLLDDPHITRHDEEREGFAESMQLSVAEKLLLLRSSSVTSVTLEDPEMAPTRFKRNANVEVHMAEAFPIWTDHPDAADELEENEKKWSLRLERVQNELRGLQAAGALPYLWDSSAAVDCTGHSQTLYIDQESQVSFLAYNIQLNSPPYTASLMVDAKTERILGFRLSWAKGQPPQWGFQGSAKFGTAWRDYWGMDSVSSAWNSEYIRSILEVPEEEFLRSGSYNANADVAFSYDGQTLRVPLVNWVYSNTDGVLEWNLM